MKVMHLISSNGFFGAEKVMLSLASNMNCNSIKSWVAAIKNLHNPHLEIIEVARRQNIPTFTIDSKGRFDINAISQLVCLIKENKINIIHTHNYKSNFIGLLVAKKAKIPIVATLHGYIDRGTKLKLYEQLDRFVLRYFDKVILVDESLKKWFRNGKVKYEIINNGIKVNELTSLRVNEFASSEIVIETVGRLSEEKGHKYLLEAFAKLVKEHPDVKLLIVGDGNLRKDLEDLSVTLKVKEKIIFAGFQKDISQYYGQMDIYVSSSLLEHFPLSILEAMSFGKAIIATDVGGTSRLIKDMFTGLLIKPAQSSEIETALLKLVKDSSLREKLGNNAKQFVKENYSLEKMIYSYRNVYEEALMS